MGIKFKTIGSSINSTNCSYRFLRLFKIEKHSTSTEDLRLLYIIANVTSKTKRLLITNETFLQRFGNFFYLSVVIYSFLGFLARKKSESVKFTHLTFEWMKRVFNLLAAYVQVFLYCFSCTIVFIEPL